MIKSRVAESFQQMPTHVMSISPLLRQGHINPGVQEWLSKMGETHMLISGILRIIHPELYESSRLAICRLAEGEASIPGRDFALRNWGTVFNAITIVANRYSPMHRDTQSRMQWFDILTSVGPCQGGILTLGDLNVTFPYPSGTVFAFSGKLLQHAASDVKGERICVAYYMRDKVQERLGVRAADWMRGWPTFL